MKPFLASVVLCASTLGAIQAATLTAAEQNAIAQISANSLRGHLSFLASDALEGRGTPSRGLDIAAEYIAAQFRRAGLEPARAGGSYFQVAAFDQVTVNMDGFRLALKSGSQDVVPGAEEVRVRSVKGMDLAGAPVLKLPPNGVIPPISGLVVAGDERRYGTEMFLNELQARKPSLILLIGKGRQTRQRPAAPVTFLQESDSGNAPVIRIRRSEAEALLTAKADFTVTLHVPQPALKQVLLRNVAAVLRGSDPVLRDQFLLITAHYDHLGSGSKGIYNGANDDGSGTVSVIEIASALATLPSHPKRSIVFMALFGEEEGLLGSFYYTHHPLVPLKKTVADINLEQLGRTDELSGKQVAAFAFTGPSYSNLPGIMEEAAKLQGVGVYRKSGADDYFDRSDNYAFAEYGIVAHTVAVAFEYPDYHGLGDKWEKVDYGNMAEVDRGIAAGILQLADQTDVPKWSDSRAAGVYREAGER